MAKERSTHEWVSALYAAFNRRDTEGVLVWMSDDVSWPRASEGGRVVGKDEIRAYWGRQWSEFDPVVEPLAVLEPEAGKVTVRVHQLVRSLAGELLSDSEVQHVYTLQDGVITRMDVLSEGDDAQAGQGPSAAFARHT